MFIRLFFVCLNIEFVWCIKINVVTNCSYNAAHTKMSVFCWQYPKIINISSIYNVTLLNVYYSLTYTILYIYKFVW